MNTLYYIDGQKVDNRSLEECQAENICRIAKQCSSAFIEYGIDAITQQNAALGIYADSRNRAIKAFTSACHAEYIRCKNDILSAQTNDNADEVRFVSPVYVETADFTPEQWVAKHLSPMEVSALSELRMALQQAGKPLGSNMAALKTWLEAMLLASADPTPRSDWQEPSVTYADAAAEAVASLASNPEA